MVSLSSLFCALLFICIAVKGQGEGCGPSTIQVRQHTTGVIDGIDMGFKVEVWNLCRCAQREVRIRVPGFTTSKLVSPTLFRDDGDAMLVGNGDPIPPNSAVNFTYWWDHAFKFLPTRAEAAC